MFPAPTTMATCTPWSRTAVTWRATATTRPGSVPNSSSPISASPESFRIMRWKAGAIAAESLYRDGLLAHGETGEPADHDILAGRGGQLVAQLLNRLALELRVVHLLLEQDDARKPGVQLALDDPLAHVLRLVGRLLLVDPRLCGAELLRHLLARHEPHGRRGGELHRHVAGEADEVLVVGDEVGVAVDLDQHADLRARVDVGLDRALGRRPLAEILDLLALPDPQDLDRLLDVARGLGEGLLAGHHPRARAVAQGLHVLR